MPRSAQTRKITGANSTRNFIADPCKSQQRTLERQGSAFAVLPRPRAEPSLFED